MKYIWKLTDQHGSAYYATRKGLLIDNAEEFPPGMPGAYTLDRHDWSKPWEREFEINKEKVTVRIERHRVIREKDLPTPPNAEEV